MESAKNLSLPRALPAAAAYAAMIASAVGLFLLIVHFGGSLTAPADAAVTSAGMAGKTASHFNALVHVLVAMTAMIALGRVLSWLFRWIEQPPVVGEVVAGIVLGPSLLGRVWPEASAFILPAGVAPYLAVVAQVGVILYMFLVGLELNGNLLRERAHASVAMSHASIVAPFLLGGLLALMLYPRLATSDVPFSSFSLFLGIAMSITAFPVLARILTDCGMTKSHIGVIALSCAATDDVTAWCLLALVVGVAKANLNEALMVVVWTLAYITMMLFVARPVITKLSRRCDGASLTPGITAAVFMAVLISSLATEWIGIHAIFGAFLLGAVIPHDSTIAREMSHKLEDLVTILLLPAFFAYTGMRTQIGLVTGVESWLICGLIIVVATLGKFGGTFAAARVTGLGWRDSAALGTLMNTRGLMELVVLNIGLDMGVISPTLFAMMVLMALVTTMTTSPVLSWLLPEFRRARVAG
ncbi:MAG TPA: cation:proton antiporter [Pirellulales bacterium]|nr:cation:proton antiporter [Pirellulales bacterium]